LRDSERQQLRATYHGSRMSVEMRPNFERPPIRRTMPTCSIQYRQ